MTYPPPPDQSGQGGYQYDPYGNQPGSQPPSPQGGGYSPQPPMSQPGYGQSDPYAAQPGMPPQMPPPAPGYGPPMATGPKNGMGTAALVLGIIGLVISWIPWINCFAWVLCILAIVFGGIGVSNANKGVATNKGAAVTGLVLGIIAIAIGVIISLVVWGSLMGGAYGSSYYN